MADEIRPTPRNPLFGLFSDFVNVPLDYMSDPRRTQQMQGIASFIRGTGVPSTLENLSYDPSGRGLFTGAGGLGGTTRMRPEAIEAALTLAPGVGPAARLAGRGAVATGRTLGPTAAKMTEGYLQRQGMMPGVIEQANPNAVWYRGQTGLKSGENPFDSTIRSTPSFADSPAVASNYAMNPNAANNYGVLGSGEVAGASVHPYRTSGKTWDLNEFQGGYGTETGITIQNLKKLAKEVGLSPKKLEEELAQNFSQNWGRGKNYFWDVSEPSMKSKNRIIPAYVVAENETLIEAAKAKGINSIQFKSSMSDPGIFDTSKPWNEAVVHQELRPIERNAIESKFSSRQSFQVPQQAAPDLLASPMYTDPFGNTIADTTR